MSVSLVKTYAPATIPAATVDQGGNANGVMGDAMAYRLEVRYAGPSANTWVTSRAWDGFVGEAGRTILESQSRQINNRAAAMRARVGLHNRRTRSQRYGLPKGAAIVSRVVGYVRDGQPA